MGNYIVTGASGGMGSAICALLRREGHRVWGLDINETEGVIKTDITDTDSILAAYERVKAEAGGINGIVHAAGIYDLNSLVEMPEEDFRRDFDINLLGMFRVNRAFVPLLEACSRVVMISSELAPLYPLPFTGIYAVTKTAVEKYAAALNMELQLLGHRVAVIRPGAVNTGLLDASKRKLDAFCGNTQLYRLNAARFKRIVGSVEAKNVAPEKIALTVSKALAARRPRLVYNINRNPLLLLLNVLPKRAQLWIIRMILK
ncbi:MAG: SDR family NAD(P)-dependent oxidoreductase [Clostridiales bacterium]|nr:SDR family NAD(P)-dependent oxidoreductase [Clostridiales bacterium]